jgi:hypothetical protein
MRHSSTNLRSLLMPAAVRLREGWLESVQDQADLENSTVDKIRRVMHLVYSTAQANDLIPRTVEANPVTHVHIATATDYEAILVTPQEAWNIICRMKPFARLLTLLIAVTGLRIGEVLALKWEHVDWGKFRIRVVSNFVRDKFGEPKSAASKKPVVLHPLVMGLLKNWRETTSYAGDEDFIFASVRLRQSTARAEHAGRRPSPPGSQACHPDFGWPSFRLPQPPACVNLVPGRDRNRLQNHSGHAALGRPINPAQGLRGALAHGQAHGGSGKDDRSHGSERENRSTVHPVGVGDRPWVILPVPCHKISAKCFGVMVARDGVERFCLPCFQQLADSTKARKDTKDRKRSFCVRIVCEFPPRRIVSAAQVLGLFREGFAVPELRAPSAMA